MTPFPYYPQETMYTCGAAVMRMALEYCGIVKSEAETMTLLGTNKVKGTKNKSFSVLAERFQLNHATIRNGTMADLKLYKRKGFVVIIGYLDHVDHIGHYAVLKKIDATHIYFWDPMFGENHKYKISRFKKMWKGYHKYDGEDGWFFAVKKP
ncbi:MAG: hypothetical protein COV60_00975 [Candidatus Magasanikbacteria bacterium CG11_big_fil_rev_8_21_14_0_20_43_7]|uniref:Peptidase C39 domain-containing protein n=1 Tax=Candidatus Magasanikbacteria bacterium CG11_big_fil_rev_8_21_14_0_20_43_7 TaxID=1974654 RepID=A0A2H0N5D9_9BACT|nr:MAG: hypothetical protein COV60_00975 [Candidatus Magasanikbacteria bacterium CG11_big_fil_rev_8_21_14_0_20_43_7]